MNADDGEEARHRQYALTAEALAERWILAGEIGRGGMSTVYLGRDVALDRPVAAKVLAPHLADAPDARARFHREARLGAKLAHPHIVPVYALEEVADTLCMILGHVDGESLGARIAREGPPGYELAVRILRETAWALAAAHAAGILHRDVTVDNILLDRQTGRAHLIDFGIAAESAHSGERLSGTAGFVAPELIAGGPASVQSDLYALGIVGWCLLTGAPPFEAGDDEATLLRTLIEPLPPLLRAAPTTPPRLAAALDECLARDPAARPASAEAWLARLDALDEPAAPGGPLVEWLTPARGSRLLYAFACSLIAFFGAAFQLRNPHDTLRTAPGEWFATLFGTAWPVLSSAVLLHLTARWRRLRGLARAGYGIADLRLVLDERTSAAPVGSRRASPRLLRATALSALLVFLLLNGLYGPSRGNAWAWPMGVTSLEWLNFVANAALAAYVIFWVGIAGLAAHPLPSRRLANLLGRTRAGLWRTAAGTLLVRLARRTVQRVAPALTLHRPTELVLDLAIEDLFAVLPRVARQELHDVPKVTAALRRHITTLRSRLARIDAAGGGVTDEVRDLRLRFADGIDQGLLALERLRLRLMQLDDASHPLGAVSEELLAGRVVERELLAALGAHPDVERLLRG